MKPHGRKTPRPFSKYSGCGNDFIIMEAPPTHEEIKKCVSTLCSRKLGIGADGLIVISPSRNEDFRVFFYNADGSHAEMCGNGARSAVHYYHQRHPEKKTYTFETAERILSAEIEECSVSIAMGEVVSLELKKEISLENATLSLVSMNTGVPHAVHFTQDIEQFAIDTIGRKVRHHPAFLPAGTNFNAVEITEDHLSIRTYERGVEGETLACGTGASAAAVAAALLYNVAPPVKVKVRSGDVLTIDFLVKAGKPIGLKLSGPCHEVFHGEVVLSEQD